MSANFWWLKPPHQDKRCTGPARDRPDGRCHNLAHQDGLCKVHLRLARRDRPAGQPGLGRRHSTNFLASNNAVIPTRRW